MSVPSTAAIATTELQSAGTPWLHRHALISIFAFCDRSDLLAVNAVSRDWQAAVLGMPPLQWRLPLRPARLEGLCASPLRRHVNGLFWCGKSSVLHSHTATLLSQRMSHLNELGFVVELPLEERLSFPAQLRSLTMTVRRDGGSNKGQAVAQLNQAIAAVGQLSLLEELSLTVDNEMWEARGSLAPLAQAPCLRRLSILPLGRGIMAMSGAQVAELRKLPNLNMLEIAPLNETLLGRLLARPHKLQWRELKGYLSVTAAMAPLLTSLPLRTLYISCLAIPHADFLLQLSDLTDLNLESSHLEPLDKERVLHAIGGCAQLRSFRLAEGMRHHDLHIPSEQLGACLTRLQKLERLELSQTTGQTTLAYLAQGSLPRSLTHLHLERFRPRLPLAELQHVLSLRELRSLTLHYVFEAPLGEAEQCHFRPPEQAERMPNLTYFRHCWWEE